MIEKKPKSAIFSDETTLELPPGYKTVILKIEKLPILSNYPENIVLNKINEIIEFINLTEITITGNEEFLQKFKDWIV